MPSLTVTESAGLVRLQLGGLARGEGASLQDAADDLMQAVLRLALALRSGGLTAGREIPPDLDAMGFLYDLGEVAAKGGDLRARVFG